MRRLLVLAASLTLLGAGCVRQAPTTPAPPPGGVYRSDDHGVSFVQKVAVATGGNLARVTVREIVPIPQEPGSLLLLASEGVFQTTTAGDLWSRVTIPARQVLSMAVHPGNPRVLLAAVISAGANSRGQILKSLTGGDTWSEIFVAPVAEETRGIVVRRRREVPTLISTIVFDPAHPEIVLAGMSNGALAVSRDGGIRWQTLTAFPRGVSALKFSPRVPNHLFIRLTDGQLLRSSDGGKTAHPAPASRRAAQKTGGPATFGFLPEASDVVHVILFLSPEPNGAETILAGTNTGLYRSADGGATWSVVPLPPTGGTGDIPVTSAAQSIDGTIWASSGFVLYESRDGGTTWRATEAPLPRPLRSVITDPVDADRLYLVFAA